MTQFIIWMTTLCFVISARLSHHSTISSLWNYFEVENCDWSTTCDYVRQQHRSIQSWKCTKNNYLRRLDGICMMRLSRKIPSAHLVTFLLNLPDEIGKINQKVILKLIDKVLSSSNDECNEIIAQKQKSNQLTWCQILQLLKFCGR